MGVLLVTAAILLASSVGVWSERRWPLAAGNAARQSLLLILYFLLPPVIFFNLASSSIDLGHGLGIALGLLAIALTAVLVWFVASRVMRLPGPQVGAMLCTVLVVNTGYLGYPMTVALLGRDQLPTAVLFDVLVGGPCLLLGAFAVGAALGTKAGESPRQRVRAFFTRNPPLYAAIAGLLAPGALAPAVLVDVSQALVIAILPIGFFAVGATLAEGAEHGELPMPPPLHPSGRGQRRRPPGGDAGAADADGGAADRPPRRLPAAGGDADRAQLDDRLPRLRPRQPDRRRGDHLVDGARRPRRPRLAGVLS